MAKLNLQSAINKNVKTTLSNAFSSTENIKQQIVILDELRSWIPAPSVEEYKQLELNIVTNGCRDALILWETVQKQVYPNALTPDEPLYVLVDGHNRYQICKSRNISFNIQLMDFADIKSVKDFMIDLQLGRRNLTPQQITYFRGLRYLNEKSDKGKYIRKSDTFINQEIEPPVGQPLVVADTETAKVESTAEKLAKEYKVGRNTILRDAEYAAGLEQLEPNLKQSILTGVIKVDKAQVQKLGKMRVDAPITSIDELTQTVTEETKIELASNAKKHPKDTAIAELNKLMKLLLDDKSYTRKRIDQLVEKALLLKTYIK